jgi:hypothetical protein
MDVHESRFNAQWQTYHGIISAGELNFAICRCVQPAWCNPPFRHPFDKSWLSFAPDETKLTGLSPYNERLRWIAHTWNWVAAAERGMIAADSSRVTSKPEVMPQGWWIAPDKRASSNRCIAGEMPTYRYLFC